MDTILLSNPEHDWVEDFGSDGAELRAAAVAYVYELTHPFMTQKFNVCGMTMWAQFSLPLAVVFGDIDGAVETAEICMRHIARAIEEPDRTQEMLGLSCCFST